MRLLFVADGRSTIARNWIDYFVEAGEEVHLISTFPGAAPNGLASLNFVPVAFSGLGRNESAPPSGALTSASTIGFRTFIRHWFGPLTVRGAAGQIRRLVTEIEPDLIHAMRLPFEGAIAAAAEPKMALVVSIWGNDFTLHAKASPSMARLTRRTLGDTQALHTDNRRDQRLAVEWGYDAERPEILVPGNGGVRSEIFYPGDHTEVEEPSLADALEAIPGDSPVVVNPRGFRAYVRNDTFFKSIPRVLQADPRVLFLCPGMAGQAKANEWVKRLRIGPSVRLLPRVSQPDLAALFRRADVAVSPSEHDGTPNTLLEAMACGALPVAGDVESVREWLRHGENGLLVDPSKPTELAEAVIHGLQGEALRESASQTNAAIISARADYASGMRRVGDFYAALVSN